MLSAPRRECVVDRTRGGAVHEGGRGEEDEETGRVKGEGSDETEYETGRRSEEGQEERENTLRLKWEN